MSLYDLVISGAGISGLIAGIRARQLGLQCVILEKQKSFSDTLRGEYFQPAGLRTLSRIGILKDVQKMGLPVYKVDHYFLPLVPFSKPNRVEFSYPKDSCFPNFALSFPHLELKEFLLKKYLELGVFIKMDSLVSNLEIISNGQVEIEIQKNNISEKLLTRH